MNIIERIRAEIERLAKSIDNATGDFAEGRRLEQRVILSFLDTLSDEPVSDDLGEEIERASKRYPEVSYAKLARIAKRFAEWGAEHLADASRMIIEDLEEAARKYRFFDFGTPDEIAQTAFKAGAEWQREQKDPTLADIAEKYAEKLDISKGWFDGCEIDELIKESYIAGAEWQKAKMLKEAVEGVVYRYESYQRMATAIIVDINRELLGNKVKIIIVKEDGE